MKCPEPWDFDSLDPLFLPIYAWLSIVYSSKTSLDWSVALRHSLLKDSKIDGYLVPRLMLLFLGEF